MTDISYDAKMSSKSLTEFTDEQDGEETKEDNEEEGVDEVVVEAVVDTTRRTTIQGMSVREIYEALQGTDEPQLSQDDVINAVDHLKEKGWLKETGFVDESSEAEDGLPRLTNKHLFHQHKKTREEILEGDTR